MVVYFDESYNDKYLVYGALFNPHSSFLHQGLVDIKNKHGFNKNGASEELKYNSTITPTHLAANKEIVNLFMNSTSYFRCVVIDLDGFDYNHFGLSSEPLKMKQARAYKKFAEMLLDKNIKSIRNAVLLCDQMTRCKGDEFIEKLKEKYQHNVPRVFREVTEIDSSLEQYQVNQVNDLLMGSVFSDLSQAKNKYKKALREHVIKSIGCTNLQPAYWGQHTKPKLDEIHPKFQVWCWRKK